MAMVYAGQQAAELVILALMGRLVLERAGPLVRNLFFPATTFAVLAALQSCWTLPIAALVHTNASAVSNAIFEPVKSLNYAALPFRMLAPVRMLVEGVVYPAGVALSGGALLWMQSALAPQVVLAVALVLSILFAAASGLVGLSFLPSLLRSLRLRAVSPSEYSNCEPGRRFSQSDIRYLLLHPDPEARSFGRDLARRLAPHLLRAEGHGRSPIWAAGATAIGRLAHGLSPEWSAAPGLLVANGSGAVRIDGGRADCAPWDAGRTAAVFDILHGKAQRVLRGYLRPLNERARLDRAALQHRTTVGLPETARNDLAEGLADSDLSSEWFAAPELLVSNGSGAGRFDVGRADCGHWGAGRTAADGQRRAGVSELADLGRGLEHACGAARRTAARLLARNGDAAVSTAAERLSSDRPEVVEAAIQTLGAIRTRKAQRVLRDYLRPLYKQARLNLAALQHVTRVSLSETARNDFTEGLADSNRRKWVSTTVRRQRRFGCGRGRCQRTNPGSRLCCAEARTDFPFSHLLDRPYASRSEHA